MNAVRTLVMRLLLLLLPVASLGVAGCGAGETPPPADPWPLVFGDATVLGYAVVSLPSDLRDGLLEETLGWTPAGLSPDRPIGLVRFDSSTFGGPAALLFPVEDGAAFLRSLETCPGIESLGGDRFVFRPPLQSELGMLLMVASGWDARSPMDILSSLGRVSSLAFQMDVRVEDGHALAVPSFEALAVCRDFLENVRGFADARPAEVLLSLDLDQLRIAYAEQIRNADQQLKALVAGVQLAGPFAMMRAHGRGADADPGVSINWDLVWAVREMLDLSAVEALQVHAAAPAGRAGRGETAAGRLLESLDSVRLRVKLASDSALQPVLASLRPVPAELDALLLLSADPERFAPAVAAWCRPLADFVKGEGAPSDRHVQRLADLLSGWDGRLGVFEGHASGASPVILASVGERGLDLREALAWSGPLLDAAGVDDVPTDGLVEDLGDGRQVLRDGTGEIVLTTGRRGPVQWFVRGDDGEPPADLLIRFASARAAEDGPGLRFGLRDARLALRHDAGETVVDVTLPGAD